MSTEQRHGLHTPSCRPGELHPPRTLTCDGAEQALKTLPEGRDVEDHYKDKTLETYI